MNTRNLPRNVPEFGADQGASRARRHSIATIAALCTTAFLYAAFPTVAHVLNTAAVVLTGLAVLIALGVLLARVRTIRQLQKAPIRINHRN